MKDVEGFVRVTNLDGVVTVESDSLAVALTALAGHVRDLEAFSLRGRKRSGGGWEVQVHLGAPRVPAQREPERLSAEGRRYFWCCGPWAGHGHAPTCEAAER